MERPFLVVGDRAPDVRAVDIQGREHALGTGPRAVAFVPGGAFGRQALAELVALDLGVPLVAVTPDVVVRDVPFALVPDPTGRLARAFRAGRDRFGLCTLRAPGLLFRPRTLAALARGGRPVSRRLAAAFVIAPDGRLSHVEYACSLAEGPAFVDATNT